MKLRKIITTFKRSFYEGLGLLNSFIFRNVINSLREQINLFFAIIKVRNSCCVCKITLLKTFYKVHASRKTLTW